MRAIIQRVLSSSVTIDGSIFSSIEHGLLVLLGVTEEDSEDDVVYLVNKIAQMRIFGDAEGKMNLSVMDIEGEVMVISQFTLFAQTKKGNRPSYIKASKPEIAIPIYEKMIQQLSIDLGKPVQTGEFGADMKVELLNDGPVTIIIDTKNKE